MSARSNSDYINKTSNSNCLRISLTITFNLLLSLLCIPFSFGNFVSFYIFCVLFVVYCSMASVAQPAIVWNAGCLIL